MSSELIVTSRERRVRALPAGDQAVRLRRGLYAAPGEDELDRIAAAVRRMDAVASHETAAGLWGVPILGRPCGIQVTRHRRCQGTARYPDVIVHHAGLAATDVTVHRGIPVTTPARTVVDLARRRQLRAGVVAADAALRLRLCTREQLRAVAEACRGWPGVTRARDVAGFADPRAASPLESISRVAFHVYGLPRPILQATIGGYEQADFLWAAYRVIGEADGLTKYTAPEALRREKMREDGLAQLGFAVFRWTWRDAYRRPDALAHRGLALLASRGYQRSFR